QNYPNPFNPTTTIEFSLGRADYTTVKVFDTLGREVRTLVAAQTPAGTHRVEWNGLDQTGRAVSSGVYILQVVSGSFRDSITMILAKWGTSEVCFEPGDRPVASPGGGPFHCGITSKRRGPCRLACNRSSQDISLAFLFKLVGDSRHPCRRPRVSSDSSSTTFPLRAARRYLHQPRTAWRPHASACAPSCWLSPCYRAPPPPMPRGRSSAMSPIEAPAVRSSA